MALLDVIAEVRREIAAAGSGINEADAKAALITPILTELGWRGLRRIRSEYPVDQGRMRLDYALMGSGSKPVALIEAKAPREDLDSHVAQVLNYAFHEGVDICVLTTGILWWLYLPREKGNPAERRFAALDLASDDVSVVAEILESCLQYEALTSGAAESRAKDMLAAIQLEQQIRSEIPHAWQHLLAGPNDFLVELLQEEVKEVTGSGPTKEQVVEFLRAYTSGTHSPSTAVPTPVDSQPSKSAEVNQPSQYEIPRRPTRRKSSLSSSPRSYRLWGDVHRYTTAIDLWLSVASAVYQRHTTDFYQRVRASGKMQGRTRVYIQDNENGMFTPVQVPHSPYYAETNNSRERSLRLARDLLEIFGYGEQDLEMILED